MQFLQGYIYHIYNQGNNRQKIFFEQDNYLFFLRKLHTYIIPYADIIAWCLMPNHFHFMVLVNQLTMGVAPVDVEGRESEGFASSETLALSSTKQNRTLNQSIGILLRSYTNAINKQQGRSGALFREQTKSECVNCFRGLTPSFIIKDGITQNNQLISERQYPQVLFNYIHQNPVRAGLVKRDVDWEFSSARDYANLRNGKLVNKQVAKEYIDW